MFEEGERLVKVKTKSRRKTSQLTCIALRQIESRKRFAQNQTSNFSAKLKIEEFSEQWEKGCLWSQN